MPNLDRDGDAVLLTPGGDENRFSRERVRARNDLLDEAGVLRTAPARFPGAGR